MKRRIFQQNKLWRDGAVEMMEKHGSIVHWTRLSDDDYEKQLRLKILEEAQEVNGAITKSDLCNELGDILEIIDCLCAVNSLTLEEVQSVRKKKQMERGSFIDRKYVSTAEHIDGSPGALYCLA